MVATTRPFAPQLLACSAKNMILLSYGMSLGFVTIAIPALEAHSAANGTADGSVESESVTLSKPQISWFGSINWIMVAVGGIVSGPFATPWGRKPAMIAVNFCFVVGYLVFYLAESVSVLYLAQAVCGFGGGLLEAPVLTYIAEIAEPHLRGAMSASTTAVLILGLFIDFSLGSVLHWRTVALLNIAAPVLAVISLCFVPESPHWLVGQGRVEDARRALCWLRGWAQPEDVAHEMAMLERTLKGGGASEKRPSPLPSLTQLRQRTFLVPFCLVVYAFFVGHWSGMTPLQTFAVSIFTTVGTPINKYHATVLIGLVELTGTIACVALVHYTGKRPLALMSTLGAGVCFVVAASYVHVMGEAGPDAEGSGPYSWLPMAALVVSAFISHAGIRILPWMLIGEVYTPDIKGFASGASGCMGYVIGFSANKSFFFLQEHLTLPGTFWLYGAVALSGTVVMYFFLPETEGHHLHEILEHFNGERVLRSKGGQKKVSNCEKWAADNPAIEPVESRL
ncbi:facilitated trehalose transporter Tret1-like [Frankliniella occidentalis]|uniref:Facilitated trehalose transporter Tret1-like n=1 Tax=Frankliniella occidentalis TaxID=133901 RepID=A0A9C6XVM7_FRAOC|nr:facilitated trehalose transporter Tret1-like [Frankliniella occidentalis]